MKNPKVTPISSASLPTLPNVGEQESDQHTNQSPQFAPDEPAAKKTPIMLYVGLFLACLAIVFIFAWLFKDELLRLAAGGANGKMAQPPAPNSVAPIQPPAPPVAPRPQERPAANPYLIGGGVIPVAPAAPVTQAPAITPIPAAPVETPTRGRSTELSNAPAGNAGFVVNGDNELPSELPSVDPVPKGVVPIATPVKPRTEEIAALKRDAKVLSELLASLLERIEKLESLASAENIQLSPIDLATIPAKKKVQIPTISKQTPVIVASKPKPKPKTIAAPRVPSIDFSLWSIKSMNGNALVTVIDSSRNRTSLRQGQTYQGWRLISANSFGATFKHKNTTREVPLS